MRKQAIFFCVLIVGIVLILLLPQNNVFAQYCICGDTFCDSVFCSETPATCPADCGPATYNISGYVWIDVDGDQVRDGGEPWYNSGAAQIINLNPGPTDNTNSTGNYSFTGNLAGDYQIVLTVPSGYRATTSTTRNVTVGPSDSTGNNFGIQDIPNPTCTGVLSLPGSAVPGEDISVGVSGCDPMTPTPTVTPIFNWDPPTGTNPQCNDGGDNDGDGLNNSSDPGCHEGGNPSNPYNPNDDSESNPSDTCQDTSVHSLTNTSTSSSGTWTAPTCPGSPLSCTVSVTVNGAGGSTVYSDIVNVSAAYSITTNIRTVSDTSSCISSSGDPYTGSVNVNASGGNLSPGGTTQSTSTGSTVFACLPTGNYQVTLIVPSGYSLVGRSGGTSDVGVNGISVSPLSSNSTLNFCIAQIDPWFQVTTGNARLVSLINPVPLGQYGASSPTYPGIFYSSESNAQFGFGSASTRNWVVSNEYSFNAETENRNGSMSYDFYKAKANRDGVSTRPISSGTLNWGQIDPTSPSAVDGGGNGVYEVTGNLTISSSPPAAVFNSTNRSRVVILVSGNVTIDAPISIPEDQGFLIVASRGNITIDEEIGTPNPINSSTLSQTTTHLDGYYSAQGDITLLSRGNTCSDGLTSDRRLNVGGALIANSLKPFSSSGLGSVQNNRSLCGDTVSYPPLNIISRPDFLVQMTDFYKTSYSKWKEVSP